MASKAVRHPIPTPRRANALIGHNHAAGLILLLRMIAILIALGLGRRALGDVPDLLTPIVRRDAVGYSAITVFGPTTPLSNYCNGTDEPLHIQLSYKQLEQPHSFKWRRRTMKTSFVRYRGT